GAAPDPLDLAAWVADGQGGWVNLETGTLHDAPGTPPLDQAPGPLTVTFGSPLFTGAVTLHGDPATKTRPNPDGTNPFDGATFNPDTLTYHQGGPDGPIIGYHQSIDDQVSD